MGRARALAGADAQEFGSPRLLMAVHSCLRRRLETGHGICRGEIACQGAVFRRTAESPGLRRFAPTVDPPEPPIRQVVFPSSTIGGGYPAIVAVQGREHVASIGCLLGRPHRLRADEPPRRRPRGAGFHPSGRRAGPLGVSSGKQLTRMPFQQLYPEWAGRNVCEPRRRSGGLENQPLDGVSTAGALGPLADLGTDNLSLRLIGCPVRAYGCASGQMRARSRRCSTATGPSAGWSTWPTF